MANRTATLDTSKGVIKFELYEDKAPDYRAEFRRYRFETGFYNGLTFHRYEPNFVIQGGCPTGTGTGDYSDPKTGKRKQHHFAGSQRRNSSMTRRASWQWPAPRKTRTARPASSISRLIPPRFLT